MPVPFSPGDRVVLREPLHARYIDRSLVVVRIEGGRCLCRFAEDTDPDPFLVPFYPASLMSDSAENRGRE